MHDLRATLLAWYRPRRTAYPWRTNPPDPYRVLVSEVMLQQTQASRVVAKFEAFLARFPSLESLAKASKADVLRTWSGLGYNRRALALQASARAVIRDQEGSIPSDPAALVRLPGVGPYTAAAVASIAYGVPVPALDTNARRVVARAILGRDGHEAGERVVREAAQEWLDGADPAKWNQAVMDLGREMCRAIPRCGHCPLRMGCRFVGRRPARSNAGRPKFEGSMRQVRGAIMRAMLDRSPATLTHLAKASSFTMDRVSAGVKSLSRDGLVTATPAALAGRGAGRVRLPE